MKARRRVLDAHDSTPTIRTNLPWVYWFAEAKRVAEATQEEWLFLTGIMYTDGWVERDGTDSKGNTLIAWTMATG